MQGDREVKNPGTPHSVPEVWRDHVALAVTNQVGRIGRGHETTSDSVWLRTGVDIPDKVEVHANPPALSVQLAPLPRSK